MTQKLHLVDTDMVQDIWPLARPLVEKALAHSEGQMLSADALRMILNNKQQLWVGFEEDILFTAVVTELINYPRHKILRIITFATQTGYGMDHWYDTIVDTLTMFGRSLGCNALEAWCRKGLARKLDWEHNYTVIVKPIKLEE
tara:strand:- start:963 stop:1391 length:429 start_codon:yes stop_codon:yes gene_type:complete